PLFDKNRESSYHLFPLRIKDITEGQRDMIIDDIAKMGVAVNVHFIPLPMLTYFKGLGYQIANYPVAYHQYAREISLPIYPQLSDAEINFIIRTVIIAVQKQFIYLNGQAIQQDTDTVQQIGYAI
ncbi:MAG: DegT/DnrJ/EryC1/StrS family aminotransferase, partial [Mucilaginibacter sp.]